MEAVGLARRHPEVYTHDADPAFAERAVILDIALRLRVSEDQVRNLHASAAFARERLPALWDRAREGFASVDAVVRVCSRVQALVPAADAPGEIEEAAWAAIALVDAQCAQWVLACPPEAFRRRLKKLVDRLLGDAAARRHTRAMADRHVVVSEAGDGMSWISALVPTIDAIAAFRRLTATAKHLHTRERDGRTRDQLRADLFSAWLRGQGTPTAVRTKVFVTVPVQILAGEPVPVEQAAIVGGDTIDPLTAKQLFLDSPSFRRVITDPVKGVVVDMDRRAHRPTKAQRDWLTLRHGTCARDGCSRLALDADVDHDRPWARGGTTDLDQLRPLCPRDHRHRHRTRVIYRTRPDHTVQVITPTGHESTAPPPF